MTHTFNADVEAGGYILNLGHTCWKCVTLGMGFEDWLCYRKAFLYCPDSTNVVYLKSPSKKKRVVRREAEVLGMREDLQQFLHRVSLVNGFSPFNDTLSTLLVQALDYLLRVLMSVGVDFIARL